MPHTSERDKLKARALPSAPHMTVMPLSPPKTSPSPPGLPPLARQHQPDDLFAQPGPSSHRSLRKDTSNAMAKGVQQPIDVDQEPPPRQLTPPSMPVDLVVQCKACRTILGDSSAYVAARKDLRLLVLSSVSPHVLLSTPPTRDQDPDLNSIYLPLDITCGSCSGPLGKVYRMTAAGLDELRDGYSFDRDRISVYQLGTGVRSPMLAPLPPAPQLTTSAEEQWRRPHPVPNSSSDDDYSFRQSHRGHQRSSPTPSVAPGREIEGAAGGIAPFPGHTFAPYPYHPQTPGGPPGPGPYGFYNRSGSIAHMHRTPSIGGPPPMRGSVGPLSMRGSVTPGPAGSAGGAGAATVASLKQKAIMIEMGDRIKSLESGIGNIDERVRSVFSETVGGMLEERMGPVEGMLRQLLQRQGVAGGAREERRSAQQQVEQDQQASSLTSTPHRPSSATFNGNAKYSSGASRLAATTPPTASSNGGGGGGIGGMPPPSSVPRATGGAGSLHRVGRPIAPNASGSGTPLRKRIVDQRKSSVAGSIAGSPDLGEPFERRAQSPALHTSAAQTHLGGSAVKSTPSPAATPSRGGSTHPQLLNATNKSPHQLPLNSSTSSTPGAGGNHRRILSPRSPHALHDGQRIALGNLGTGGGGGGGRSISTSAPSASTPTSASASAPAPAPAPASVQYDHDELDGLDNSFDGLDGEIEEGQDQDQEGAAAAAAAEEQEQERTVGGGGAEVMTVGGGERGYRSSQTGVGARGRKRKAG